MKSGFRVFWQPWPVPDKTDLFRAKVLRLIPINEQSELLLSQKSCQDHEPYIIHRADNNHVVVLSLDDFNAWQETLYLLSNPTNAQPDP